MENSDPNQQPPFESPQSFAPPPIETPPRSEEPPRTQETPPSELFSTAPAYPVYNEPLPGGYGVSPYYGSHYGPRTPEIRFDVISEAWRFFQQKMGTWIVATLLGGLIMCIPMIALMAPMVIMMNNLKPGATPNPGPPFGIGIFAIYFLIFIVIAFVNGGMTRMAILQIRGKDIGLADMFSVTDVFLPLVGTLFCTIIVYYIGACFCLIPGLLAQSVLMLAVPLVVDAKMGTFDAMKKSYQMLKPQMWMALIFHWVIMLIAGIGVYACGIGALFTAPLLPLSVAITYRDFFIAPPQYVTQTGRSDSGEGPPIPEAY